MSAPTRDVLVTRDMSGERTFAGFGAAANEEYADAMIEADKLPLGAIKVGCRSGWPSWSKCSTAGLLQSCSMHCKPGFPRNWDGLGKQGLLTCTELLWAAVIAHSTTQGPLRVPLSPPAPPERLVASMCVPCPPARGSVFSRDVS